MTITIRELKGEGELQDVYPLVVQRNSELSKDEFSALLADMLPQGYRCISAFDDDEMVGISGFWIKSQFYCRKTMRIDNLYH